MARRIIIGYDPDHRGKDALRLGRQLAELISAKPVVVSVVYCPVGILAPEELEQELERSTDEGFAVARDELAGLEPQTLAVGSQSASASLHEIADNENAMMIVLGSCHRGTVGRTLLGSVCESLLHGAPCAIAVAPRGYDAWDGKGVLRIGVAFDGSPEAWAALETGIGIARRTPGELSIVTVAGDPKYGLTDAYSTLATAEFRDHEREDRQRVLDLALSRVPETISAEGSLLDGDAGDALAELSGKVDLLVTGSRGHGPLRRTLLGSTTRKLLREARCPVLVLPRGAGVDPLHLDAPDGSPTRVAA